MFDVKNHIRDAIVSITNKHYFGYILQCLKIMPDESIGTMGVAYHKPMKSIVLLYSPSFVEKLSWEELKAVLIHEIDHILRKHIYIYNALKLVKSDAKRLNIAMDLVINQKIKDLPKMGVFIEHFKTAKGKPFPENESTETYYDLLEGASYDNPDGSGEGPQTMDKHYWDDIDSNEFMDATKELVKRANYLHEKTYGTKCQELSDLINDLTKIRNDIDYKKLLLSTLRNSIPAKDIKKTWTRPSRRFGLAAKGSKIKEAPSVSIYADTSGSISYEELNSSLNIITDVIKQGCSKINVFLFHERLYHTQKFKKGTKFDQEQLQSGGTELSEVITAMQDSQDEIHIVLTDGHYGTNSWDKSLNSKKVVFLIRQGGNLDHPLKGLGKTMEYKNV